MKNNTLIIFIKILLISCSCSENIHDKMYAVVQKQIDIDSCEVNFSEMIEEPWEELYIIDEYIMPSEISQALGFNYSGDMTSDREYLFIVSDGKKILKESSNYSSQIVFDNPNTNGIVKISVTDTFCAEYNTKISPHFYSLKKKGGWQEEP